MSLHLNFEPHGWYMGFAIKDPGRDISPEAVDAWNEQTPEQKAAYRFVYPWRAYTDDGNTYRIVELEADTLRELRQKIRHYHLERRNGHGERIAARRLEYLRGELQAERISYGELAELADLREYIASDDVELLQAAGVEEAEI